MAPQFINLLVLAGIFGIAYLAYRGMIFLLEAF